MISSAVSTTAFLASILALISSQVFMAASASRGTNVAGADSNPDGCRSPAPLGRCQGPADCCRLDRSKGPGREDPRNEPSGGALHAEAGRHPEGDDHRSGPIVIGQACEFDYSGTQACKALRALGYQIVLANSNPATIMTDPGMADVTYLEPLNLARMTEIIEKERPDALLPNLGGQSGLNLSSELAKAGVLERYGVKVIGGQTSTRSSAARTARRSRPR